MSKDVRLVGILTGSIFFCHIPNKENAHCSMSMFLLMKLRVLMTKNGWGTMAKKYKITLTEEQMRIVQKCTEFYMRVMMGQSRDFADELAFWAYDHVKSDEQHFKKCIWKRDVINEIMTSIFRIVFDSDYYGVPSEKTEDGMMAECIWDAVRFARGLSRWDQPFQIGSEPSPEIEVIEDGETD